MCFKLDWLIEKYEAGVTRYLELRTAYKEEQNAIRKTSLYNAMIMQAAVNRDIDDTIIFFEQHSTFNTNTDQIKKIA